MVDQTIYKGYIPGLIGSVTGLHANYYSKYWGFGSFFEAKVASEMSEFINRYNENWDSIWRIVHQSKIVGSLTIDGIGIRKQGAHLRWFIVGEAVQGKGFGNLLMDKAVKFCKDKGYERIYLWTFFGLEAARHLYEKYGFLLVEEKKGKHWGQEVLEQKFELIVK